MAVFGKKNLFTQLQFNETVAETVYDNIRELYNDAERRGAIVKYDANGKENYVIIAMLADDLVNAFGKKFKKNEEVGAFSASINDGLIQAVLVEGDFQSGTLGLIPTVDTLADMTEWSFVEKTPLHIAIVTPDFNAEDGVVLLSDTVTVNELKNIKNGHMTIVVTHDENGEPDEAKVVKTSELKAAEPTPEPEPVVEDVAASAEEPVEEPIEPVAEFDENHEDDVPEFDPSELNEEELYEPHDDVVYDESVFEDLPEADDEFVEEATVAQSEAQQPVELQHLTNVQELILKQLNSDSLDIKVTDDDFYDLFAQDKHPIELFNETPTDPNNHLDVHVAQMSSVANTKILRFLDESVNSLASEYQLALRTFADKLTNRLDYHDESTDAGKKFKEIKERRQELVNAAIEAHELKKQDVQQDYEARKDKFIKERMLQAEREFDDENRAQLEKDTTLDTAKLELDGDDFEAKNLQDLHTRRRDVARVFMERAITDLLVHYRDEMAKVYKKARELALEESKSINRYIEQNFASEVMRANAIQKQLDMQADLKSLQDKFDAQLVEKNNEIQLLREKAEADYAALKEKSDIDLVNLKEELNKELEAERTANADLRKALERMTEKYEKLDEKKEAEYKHRLKVVDDRNQALERRLEDREKDVLVANRNRWIVAALLTLVAAIAGVLVTAFVMNQGQNTTNNVTQAQITQLKRELDDAKKDVQSAKTETNNVKAENNTKQAQIDSLTKVLNERKEQTQTSQP
jgi:hypothetical protein